MGKASVQWIFSLDTVRFGHVFKIQRVQWKNSLDTSLTLRAFGVGGEKKKKGEKSEVRTGAVLNSCVSETKQKRGEKYKEQEKIVRDIQWEREWHVKKKKKMEFFFAQVVFLSVVISI